jgi:myo-inositol 2-dehydrogenase/D-chiro-inositol 1-dehydrogenase
MTIRIALLGAGIMGADHARIVAGDLPGTRLQVVCDASVDRARRVADDCGAVEVATDPMAVIGRSDVDAVLIASPDETHAPLTLAAIAAGKPVLCEKPLAPTSADGRKVIEAELEAGRQLVHLGFMRRFDPAYREMKKALADGTLGRAIMMHNFHRNVAAPANFTGPMAITNSAPHEFDVARFVLDTDYAAISVFQPAGIDTGRVGAPVFIVLETTGGQLVTIEINNNAAYGYDVRGELVGEKGSISLNAPVRTRLNVDLRSVERYAPDWRPRFAEAYRLQNKAWIRAIETGVPSPIAANAWNGYCATIIAEAGVRALAEGRKVAVELPAAPDLYRRDGGATEPFKKELAS